MVQGKFGTRNTMTDKIQQEEPEEEEDEDMGLGLFD